MKYGCHNRDQFVRTIWVFDGYVDNPKSQRKTVNTKEIEHRMQPGCQYTHSESGKTDPRCEGCKHKGQI